MCRNALKTASKFDTSQVYKEMGEVINHVMNNNQDAIDSSPGMLPLAGRN